nr:carboxypeptidase regulatory-like domain-containing protein [Anaerolineae bacterium]
MIKRLLFLLVLGLILTLAACKKQEPIYEQGMNGYVYIGPVCGIDENGEEACDIVPYQATLHLKIGGMEPIEIVTEEDGTFWVGMAPGEYVIEPQPGPGFASAGEVTVTVPEGEFVEVLIVYDNGMR